MKEPDEDPRMDTMGDSNDSRIAGSEAFVALMSMGLNERAIVLLIHDAIGQKHGQNAVPKQSIRMVLEAARRLPQAFSSAPASEALKLAEGDH